MNKISLVTRQEKVRQVVDLIMEEFTPEEISKLNVTYDNRIALSYREYLDWSFKKYKVKHDLETSKKLIKEIVNQYRLYPELKAKRRMNEEFEVKLFKPTLAFRLELWELWRQYRRDEKSYALSHQRLLNQ